MKKIILSTTLLAAIFLTSCGTMFVGKKHSVTIDSNVKDDVFLIVDGRTYSDVKLPYTVKLTKNVHSNQIRLKSPGYKTGDAYSSKSVNGVTFMNFLNLGFGFIVDIATSNITVPAQKYIYIELEKSE